MTQQEQFEADYLAAFPRDPLFAHFPKKEDGSYWLDNYNDTHAVWLQQAKRHGAEIAELVTASDLALEWLKAALECKDWVWDFDQRECAEFSVQHLSAAIAKYEVKK